MYETGHIAIGIICSKLMERVTRIREDFPLLCILSILPDVDVFHPFAIKHGGPTHSIIFITLIFFPFFLLYGSGTIPYFVAALSHPMIGDLIFCPLSIFWPLSL